MNLNLYLVKSDWAVDWINVELEKIAKNADIDTKDHQSPVEIVYRNYGSTNTSMVFVSDEFYDRIKDTKDFKIQPYRFNNSNLPQPGYSYSLFIRTPYVTEIENKEQHEIVKSKLDTAGKYLGYSSSDLNIRYPLYSRRGGGSSKGYFIVTFNETVNTTKIVMTKAYINFSIWDTSTSESIKCFWCKDRSRIKPTAILKRPNTSAGKPLDSVSLGRFEVLVDVDKTSDS